MAPSPSPKPRSTNAEATPDAQALSAHFAHKKVFTTGEAAEVCKVSQQTIIRCFDAGRLTGFRVPGSKFRRIPREELLRFMRENHIPTAALEGDRRRVLIVDDDQAIVEMLTEALQRDGRFEAASAMSGYDAGLMTSTFKPHAVLLDYMLPDINGNIVCRRLRDNPEMRHVKIILISGVVRREEIDMLLAAGADEFVQKPFDILRLINRLAELTETGADAAA
ncbi:MAG: response regulator [Phycisphaerales bacterium]